MEYILAGFAFTGILIIIILIIRIYTDIVDIIIKKTIFFLKFLLSKLLNKIW